MKQKLEAGIGIADITPHLGSNMAGYYYPRHARAVHDRLTAKAVVFADGKNKAALITCDVCGLDKKAAAAIQALISGLKIVEPDKIILCATHTHTGPVINGKYIKILAEGVEKALRQAYAALAPATFRYQKIDIGGLFFNRRYFMKNGQVMTNPEKCNPDVVKPAGPVFKKADVLWIDFAGEKSWAIVNIPGHPDTVGGDRISADYPYYIGRHLQNLSKKTAGVIYTNAPCGDINHWDIENPSPQRGFAEAKRIGDRIGAEIFAGMKSAKPLEIAKIKTSSRNIDLSYVRVGRAQVAQARSILRRPYPEGVDFTLEVVEAKKIMRAFSLRGKQCPMTINAIALGPVVLIGMPAELFAGLGMQIKEKSPFKATFINDLAFAPIGYIAPARAWKEGGYEVTSSVYRSGVGEKIVKATLEVLNKVKT